MAFAILLDALFDGSMEMFEFVEKFRCAAGTSGRSHVTPCGAPLRIIPRDDLAIMIAFLREARWLLLAVHVAAPLRLQALLPQTRHAPERTCRQLVSLARCKKTSVPFNCWPADYAPYSVPELTNRMLEKARRRLN